MAKKKTKAKKKKVVRKKKKVVRKKKAGKVKVKAKAKGKGEKALGMVDHFFGKIAVAGVSLKAPIKVGDVVHIKGHTTDFVQKIESMQIEHERVLKAKKGDDIGLKVKGKVRQHDIVYLAATPSFALQAKPAKPAPPPQAKPQEKKPSSYSDTKFLKF